MSGVAKVTEPEVVDGPVASKVTRDEPSVGKYKLIKTIGKGNFAKVKLAKHVPTDREVAIIYNLLTPSWKYNNITIIIILHIQ